MNPSRTETKPQEIPWEAPKLKDLPLLLSQFPCHGSNPEGPAGTQHPHAYLG